MTAKPMYFPDGFDMNQAKICLSLVDIAYDMYIQWNDFKTNVWDIAEEALGWKKFEWTPKQSSYGQIPHMDYSNPIWADAPLEIWHFKLWDSNEPFAFIAKSQDGPVYLVFRGTKSDADWTENADFDEVSYELASNYGTVHHGFYGIYKSMSTAIITALKQYPDTTKLYVTGHSLGSALSTLAVPDILANVPFKPENVKHYNFASPKTANKQFASTYNQNGVDTYRLVNTCDLVTDVPPSSISKYIPYQHIGIPVCFTAQHGSVENDHDVLNSYGYALDHPDQPENDKA